jgi:L-malate glycosyltransferase
MKKVLIIEAQMKEYRAPFYALLYEALRRDGVHLTVAYSDPPPSDVQKNDTCELPLDYSRKIRSYWLWPNRLLYQPLIGRALGSDLVIVDQGNRFLLNHVLLPLSCLGLRRVAFWGLGENLQAGQLGISEWYRRKTLNWASWWFAYTKGTARYLEAQGVPSWKMTAVQNSVDTRGIREHMKLFTAQDRAALRGELGIPTPAPVGIFCGMLDRVKSVPFLIESSRMIKKRVPDFHLIIVGGGPEKEYVERQARDCAWIHMMGPRFGKEKAEFMAISQAFLLPGRVGLAVLDAFAGGLPLITTKLPIHGPEIEYLEENVNGLMTADDPVEYAGKVASVFNEPDHLARLQAGARASAEKYSIENMAANFRTGIRLCLGLTESRITVLDRDPSKAESKVGTPSNGSGFAMTTSWDDGHPLDLKTAELLSKYGLKGTFYVPLENTRPTLSSEQIHELSSAFEIGAHTVHHLVLTTLPRNRALSEITECKSRLQEITGKPCPAFCFPSGRYAAAHLEMLGDVGYSAVRTAELLSLDRPRAHNGVVIIPTTIQAYPHTSAAYLRNAGRRFRYEALRNLVQHSPGRDWSSAAISLLQFAHLTGGVFHLWGHSWEIEEYKQWGALERVFAAMAEASRSAVCLTNSELCRHGR